MTLGLGNMRALLARIDHPEKSFRSVVIAGTNGKGSVAAYLASLLHANGLAVGRYTSPHVYSVTERVWVSGEPISLERMEALASRIVPLYSTVPFSYFEAITAIAFLEFAERGVDYAVLEVGLGGRFDATNVVDPSLTILTNISIDHRRILGDSEEEILREKLGITREGVPLLIGNLSDGILPILERKAKRDGVPLLKLDGIGTASLDELSVHTIRAKIRTNRSDYGELRLPFKGEQQIYNALLAVGAAECLLERVHNVSGAFESTYLPGRFEAFKRSGKTFFLDVAHNDAALSASAETLSKISEPESNAVVIGMMRRKELMHSPGRFLTSAKRVYLTAPEAGEAYAPQELLAKFFPEAARRARCEVVVWNSDNPSTGWDLLVRTLLHPSTRFSNILVTGSHRTVECFGRRLFEKEME